MLDSGYRMTFLCVSLCVFLCDLCVMDFFTTENTEEMHTEVHREIHGRHWADECTEVLMEC